MLFLVGGGEEVVSGNGIGSGTREPDALGVNDIGLRELLLNAREQRDRMRRCAVVVADKRVGAVGVGADDGDAFVLLLQWQEVVVVLKQDDGFVRGLQGKRAMFFRVVLVLGDLRP